MTYFQLKGKSQKPFILKSYKDMSFLLFNLMFLEIGAYPKPYFLTSETPPTLPLYIFKPKLRHFSNSTQRLKI